MLYVKKSRIQRPFRSGWFLFDSELIECQITNTCIVSHGKLHMLLMCFFLVGLYALLLDC